jgi:signal transduction histidine kinase
MTIRALFRSTGRQRTRVDINHLVRDVLKMVENDLRVPGVTASTELQEDIPQIAGDPTQLQQVVLMRWQCLLTGVPSGG